MHITQPLCGRQGSWGGKTWSRRWSVHSRGLFEGTKDIYHKEALKNHNFCACDSRTGHTRQEQICCIDMKADDKKPKQGLETYSSILIKTLYVPVWADDVLNHEPIMHPLISVFRLPHLLSLNMLICSRSVQPSPWAMLVFMYEDARLNIDKANISLFKVDCLTRRDINRKGPA